MCACRERESLCVGGGAFNSFSSSLRPFFLSLEGRGGRSRRRGRKYLSKGPIETAEQPAFLMAGLTGIGKSKKCQPDPQ